MLGVHCSEQREICKEVKKRAEAGWRVRSDLGQKNSSESEKKVYRRVVRPAGLFGLEMVALTQQEEQLEEAEVKMDRLSLGETGTDRMRNETISGTAHIRRFEGKVREARLRWFGHA